MVSFYSSIHCPTLYVAFFPISISFSRYKAFCKSFFEGAKIRKKSCFFHIFSMIASELDRNLKKSDVWRCALIRGTEWYQIFICVSKIVGEDAKIVQQNVTFQESQKTKHIPIVFAIFEDFGSHFEGVLFVVGSKKFWWWSGMRYRWLWMKNPKMALFAHSQWSSPLKRYF